MGATYATGKLLQHRVELNEPNFHLVVFCFIGWWGNYPSNMAHSGGSTDENSKVNVEETKNN